MKLITKYRFLCLILTVLMLITINTICYSKYFANCDNKVVATKSINHATIKDLDNIPGIGVKTATNIVEYISCTKVSTVDDLQGKIPYLGDTKIKSLKKYYK